MIKPIKDLFPCPECKQLEGAADGVALCWKCGVLTPAPKPTHATIGENVFPLDEGTQEAFIELAKRT